MNNLRIRERIKRSCFVVGALETASLCRNNTAELLNLINFLIERKNLYLAFQITNKFLPPNLVPQYDSIFGSLTDKQKSTALKAFVAEKMNSKFSQQIKSANNKEKLENRLRVPRVMIETDIFLQNTGFSFSSNVSLIWDSKTLEAKTQIIIKEKVLGIFICSINHAQISTISLSSEKEAVLIDFLGFSKERQAIYYLKDFFYGLLTSTSMDLISFGFVEGIRLLAQFIDLDPASIQNVIDLRDIYPWKTKGRKVQFNSMIKENFEGKAFSGSPRSKDWSLRPLPLIMQHYSVLCSVVNIPIFLNLKEQNPEICKKYLKSAWKTWKDRSSNSPTKQ